MTDLLDLLAADPEPTPDPQPEPERFARKRECSVHGCHRALKARGLCGGHYRRLLRGMDVDSPLAPSNRSLPLVERLWAKVEKAHGHDGCWNWTGALDGTGYGRIFDGSRLVPAHRALYEIAVGPVPDGLDLDHLCRNRQCVRPSHLEPVTNRENILRGESPTAKNARKTHCRHGHEFTPENTRRTAMGRRCRECDRERQRATRRAKSEGLAA